MNSFSTLQLPRASAGRELVALPFSAATQTSVVKPAAKVVLPAQQMHTARQLAAQATHRAQVLAQRRSSIHSSAKRF
ncbi:hypothetical protein [Hymenobacter cellulosilyticus]|uniref:Uncharacterized protein n=1 Tax=Hymenobacter cellulosilyticus TaxID=2932248 RepID=A0A8T9Q7S3_9BACT|nr:hypothetical protein [Hymenobacter cellulosilyticus]UOQ72471.1 hypothetical protein MUN79_00185 [Hymenobacter cellulosilyticus]